MRDSLDGRHQPSGGRKWSYRESILGSGKSPSEFIAHVCELVSKCVLSRAEQHLGLLHF